MSRPSITRLPNWAHSRCLSFIHWRTAGTAATWGTAALTAAVRISFSG
jgi:hypothetical protein